MTPLREIADLLSHLGDALANVSRGVYRSVEYGYHTYDLVTARRAKLRLTKIHRKGSELGAIQNSRVQRYELVFP